MSLDVAPVANMDDALGDMTRLLRLLRRLTLSLPLRVTSLRVTDGDILGSGTDSVALTASWRDQKRVLRSTT